MFLGQGLLWQQVWNCLNAIEAQSLPSSTFSQDNPNQGGSLKDCTARLKTTLSNLSVGEFDPDQERSLERPLKRKRTETDMSRTPNHIVPPIKNIEENELPPDDLIDDLVEIYFANVHPWIPILHVRQFRERMRIPAERKKLTNIFHAIVSLCVRFSMDPRLDSPEVRLRFSKLSRQTVILQSMESFSVENLQALVICAFDTVSSGRLLSSGMNLMMFRLAAAEDHQHGQ